MTKKENVQLLRDLLDLRKKEIWEGLSDEEERKVTEISNEINHVFSPKKPLDFKENQMNCEIAVVAVRQPQFEKRMIKQSLFDKLTKKKPIVYYDLTTTHETDFQYEHYTYRFMLTVQRFMNDVGLGIEWTQIAPPTIDMPEQLTLSFDQDEMEWIQQLPNSDWCLQMINKVKNIEDKALMYSQEISDLMLRLKNYWKNGYSVYIDYTELQFTRIGND